MVQADEAVTSPITFDLCGRTLSCLQFLYRIRSGGEDLALRNGNLAVLNTQESRLAVINVHSGTLSLELINICDASTNGSGSSQFSAAEKDDLGFHPQQQVDSVL